MHLLPAPVFRMTADLQARRRLGLTATLVREDGREGDVFSLIGPKRYDAPWKDIEAQGYIAPADCIEVRVTLSEPERMAYAVAEPEARYRLAATADSKTDVVVELVDKHRGTPTLVIGQYVDQLEDLAAQLDAPLITGDTTVRQRERLYEAFRTGELELLVVSKVANFSIDLPSAQVAIQVSGAFGSRQEEAQRLGRLFRPKQAGGTARFYAVVARDTVDPTSPPIDSDSSPSRATATGSWTPRTPSPPTDFGPAGGRRSLRRSRRRGAAVAKNNPRSASARRYARSCGAGRPCGTRWDPAVAQARTNRGVRERVGLAAR